MQRGVLRTLSDCKIRYKASYLGQFSALRRNIRLSLVAMDTLR